MSIPWRCSNYPESLQLNRPAHSGIFPSPGLTVYLRRSMALREIIIWPDPRLKGKAKPVGDVDAHVRKLCDDLADTMYSANGVGLAAPQVGILTNIIAIDVEQRAAEGEEPKKKGE